MKFIKKIIVIGMITYSSSAIFALIYSFMIHKEIFKYLSLSLIIIFFLEIATSFMLPPIINSKSTPNNSHDTPNNNNDFNHTRNDRGQPNNGKDST
jgi:hypothetical protein